MTMNHTCENDISYTEINGVCGTLSPGDAWSLIRYAPKNGRYVETGSYLGCSAVIVALNTNLTIWAHDLWVTDWSELKGLPPPKVDDYFYKFYDAVKRNKMENRIIPVRGDSVYTIGIHDDESVDFAFIDGDHSYEGCLRDLEAIWPKMKEQSPILIHDCIQQSVLEAVKKFTNDKNVKYKLLENTTGMALLFKK